MRLKEVCTGGIENGAPVSLVLSQVLCFVLVMLFAYYGSSSDMCIIVILLASP